jgi:hypothetical protein
MPLKRKNGLETPKVGSRDGENMLTILGQRNPSTISAEIPKNQKRKSRQKSLLFFLALIPKISRKIGNQFTKFIKRFAFISDF